MFHGYKLVSLILLTQTLVIFVHAFCHFSKNAKGESKYTLNDYLIRYSQVAIIAAYVVAGVAKIIISDGTWLADSHYSGVYIAKTHAQSYYTNLEASEKKNFAISMLENPTPWRIFLSGGFFLELFCFVALWNRWLMAITGIALIGFHQLVAEIMLLYFPQNEWCCFIFMVNPVFWLGALLFGRNRGNHEPAKSED